MVLINLRKRAINDVLHILNIKRLKDETNSQSTTGGSVEGRRVIDRDSESGYQRLLNDYFVENPVYGEKEFRRRFRMRKNVFLRIVDAITEHNPYFQRTPNAAGKMGLHPLQKATAALRQLCYGVSADTVDEYLRLGESTALLSMKNFCAAVVEVFGEEYLRRPNEEDTERLLEENKKRGFPGMLGSLDCMHWAWKNCPTAYHGQYTGKEKKPTMILEAVSSVRDRSDLFDAYTNGSSVDVKFDVGDQEFTMGYYLADGIYPNFANMVKTFSAPKPGAEANFAKQQEACRKDVERAFGVLQARFAIISCPARLWKRKDRGMIMNIFKLSKRREWILVDGSHALLLNGVESYSTYPSIDAHFENASSTQESSMPQLFSQYPNKLKITKININNSDKLIIGSKTMNILVISGIRIDNSKLAPEVGPSTHNFTPSKNTRIFVSMSSIQLANKTLKDPNSLTLSDPLVHLRQLRSKFHQHSTYSLARSYSVFTSDITVQPYAIYTLVNSISNNDSSCIMGSKVMELIGNPILEGNSMLKKEVKQLLPKETAKETQVVSETLRITDLFKDNSELEIIANTSISPYLRSIATFTTNGLKNANTDIIKNI
ncbi:hypothetical protein INT47_010440 [Mucor saturninus]|uniref:Uncharacterized protein n=1 Tax=Mucor saturninus TaxID=64648 RepID=A0A8H7RE78_9FUNG|nr:hypothetical protein INT47_010440 [Mucor saturninus]